MLFNEDCKDKLYNKYKSDPKLKEQIESMYSRTNHILDKDFCSHFLSEAGNRMLELSVAGLLVDYQYKNDSAEICNGSFSNNQGGPDFKLECSGYRIFIECVCAGEHKKENVAQECEYEKFGKFTVQTGSDSIIKSRISSVIFDKYKKVDKHKKLNNITDSDIVVLVVGTNFEKLPNYLMREFKEVIAYKSIVEYSDNNCNLECVQLEENNQKYFIKDGKKISINNEQLDYFNVLIHADRFFAFSKKAYEKNDQSGLFYYNYRIYVRKLQNELSKNIIEKIFDNKSIEFDSFLYKADESYSKEKIFKTYRDKKI